MLRWNVLSIQVRLFVRLLFIPILLLVPTLFSFNVPSVYATDVGGIIDVDTTWILSGSPYIVVNPVLVLEDVTLTIEPGVVVKFNGGMTIQIRGELIATGTSEQPITFTSNINPASPGDWDYLFFTDSSEDASYDPEGNYVSGSILQYVVIEYAGGSSVANNGALRLDQAAPYINHTTVRFSATDGIRRFGDGPNYLKITHCTISENAGYGVIVMNEGATLLSESLIENNDLGGAALGVYPGWGTGYGTYVATGNTFRGNNDYHHKHPIELLTQGTAEFSNNFVTNNSCIWYTSVLVTAGTAVISRNLIIANDCGGMTIAGCYYCGGSHDVLNNIISDNEGVGLTLAPWYCTLTAMHNAILRNNTTTQTAIEIRAPQPTTVSYNTILENTSSYYPDRRTVYLDGTPQFTHNNIYGNSGYALWNGNPQGTPDVDAQYNWWGTIGSAQISALIYDWFDDSSLGIVNFSPYQTLHNLDAPISPPSGFSLTPTSNSFVLNWAANPESDLVGYKVYYDTDLGYPYTGSGADQGDSPIDVGNVLEFTLTGLEQGVKYYFAVSAYDVDSDGLDDQTDGHESWFSIAKSAGMGQMPVAGFSGTPTSGLAPLQVEFTNESTGDFTGCLWDFGDGNTSLNCNDPIHNYASAGLYTVQLTVVGLPGESSLTRPDYITAYSNEAPFFTSTPVLTATQDVPYTYTAIANDPDLIHGDTLTISATTLPAWLTLTNHGDGTATLFGTPANANVGEHAVELVVTDSAGLTDTQAFTLTVANVNDPPKFTSEPVTTATQDVPYTYTAIADDPDLIHGDALTITTPTLPLWLTLADHGDGTATLAGTPANADVGEHPVVLQVTDSGGLTDTQAFTITVANVNDPPTFTSTPALTTAQGSPYIYAVTAADPDLIHGDALTITAITLPAWLTLEDHGDGTATLSGTPTNADVGAHAVVLLVTDSGGLTDTQPFTITVANVNDPPTFTSTPALTVAQGSPYIYAVTADDPDLIHGDALTITAITLPAWLTLEDHGDGTATLSGTPTNADVGAHAVVLLVTDSGGLTDTQTFTITVANVNDAPAFTSSPVMTATEDALYTYAVTADDPDLIHGDALTITAFTLPAWLTFEDCNYTGQRPVV
jgi:PKD repeat protein